nr:immunoglobulin light chain junction region [Macaca mulatta]MOX20931.1 immunoglobulin light chain junction region [Macaca mulatta]
DFFCSTWDGSLSAHLF